jgi:hypothetical protein
MQVSHGPSRVVLKQDQMFNGVQVFTATTYLGREELGDKVTDWMRSNPQKAVTEMVVAQSSDASHHCLTITVFYWEQLQRHGR